MTITQAFRHLLDNWEVFPKSYRDKYKSYRSKYLKSLRDKEAERIGEGKIKEMLKQAGYIIKTEVTEPEITRKINKKHGIRP